MAVARHAATILLLSVHHIHVLAYRRVLGSQRRNRHSFRSACPLVREVEADYEYVKAVAQIAKDIARPYVLTGGSSMGLMRFGAISIQPDPKSDRRFANDNDLDFFVYSQNDSHREAFCNELEQRCKQARIPGMSCSFTNHYCGMAWRSEGSSMVVPGKEGTRPDAYFFDLRDLNATHMVVKNWPRRWVIDRGVMFPAQKAKYYDQEFSVPHRPLEFLSNAVPAAPHQPSPEYGTGCDGVAYPSWLTSDAPWRQGETVAAEERQVTGLGISRDILDQCARALDKEGFASFSECFRTPNLECPLVRAVEADYAYVKTVLQIAHDLGCPFFLTGGSAIAILFYLASLRRTSPTQMANPRG